MHSEWSGYTIVVGGQSGEFLGPHLPHLQNRPILLLLACHLRLGSPTMANQLLVGFLLLRLSGPVHLSKRPTSQMTFYC